MQKHPRYWFRLFAAFSITLIIAVIALPFLLGGLMIWGITHPACRPIIDPAQYGLTPEAISFTTSEGYTLQGYFLRGTTDATVIISPTLGNNRTGNLNDAAILHRAGLNVLTFDSRVCGGASFHSLGYHEAQDTIAAYDYLASRDDINADHITLHGFSAAGAASLFAMAQHPQFRAVSAQGNYHDFAEQLGITHSANIIEALIQSGASTTYRLMSGIDVQTLSPLRTIDDIVPRPILLMYGSREVSLPGARAMIAKAQALGGNAELWIIEGATHGDYHLIAGEEYERRLSEFHLTACCTQQP